jgi:hypothetical protein
LTAKKYDNSYEKIKKQHSKQGEEEEKKERNMKYILK